jgi:catechol 2,3-dioxygenase-like lactoylglutathione lyase family enzyme
MAPVISTVIYPVKDLAKARTLYAALLGVAPAQDEPYYVGFRVGDQDVGLDPNGHRKGMTAPRSPTSRSTTSRGASTSSSTPARRPSSRSPTSAAAS